MASHTLAHARANVFVYTCETYIILGHLFAVRSMCVSACALRRITRSHAVFGSITFRVAAHRSARAQRRHSCRRRRERRVRDRSRAYVSLCPCVVCWGVGRALFVTHGYYIYKWIYANNEFNHRCARAREVGAQLCEENILIGCLVCTHHTRVPDTRACDYDLQHGVVVRGVFVWNCWRARGNGVDQLKKYYVCLWVCNICCICFLRRITTPEQVYVGGLCMYQ